MPVPAPTPGIHAGSVQNQEDGSDGSEIEALEGRPVGVQGLLSANHWQAQVVGGSFSVGMEGLRTLDLWLVLSLGC